MISNVSGTSASTGTLSASGVAGGGMGKDEFIKLFITQLKHQDPMNPMNADQLASQLAQFSSVEQLMNISGQMEKQAAATQQLMSVLSGSNAVGVLGRTVIAVGDQVAVPAGGDASVTVETARAGTGTLRIFDASGQEVGSRELGTVEAGRQSIPLGDAAKGLPAGTYRYSVEVADASGASVPVTGYMQGRVEGIRHTASGPVMVMGGMEVPFLSLVEVTTD